MSIETMTVVLHHSSLSGTAKLVLVGIANHQGDGGAWPSVDTLAVYANTTERTVQRALREAEDAGELHTDPQTGGSGDRPWFLRPNRYRVLTSCPPNCAGGSDHRCRVPVERAGKDGQAAVVACGERASRCGHDRVTPLSPGDVAVTPRGDARVTPGVTPVSPEPSTNPQENGGGAVARSTTDRARETPGQRAARESEQRRAAARARAADPEAVARYAAAARAGVAAAAQRRRAAAAGENGEATA